MAYWNRLAETEYPERIHIVRNDLLCSTVLCHCAKGGEKKMKKMDKSKCLTLLWVVSLAVMVLVTLVMTVAEPLVEWITGEEAVLPLGLVIFCGIADAMALFGFAYGMVKKLEERRSERYDELYENRFYGGRF